MLPSRLRSADRGTRNRRTGVSYNNHPKRTSITGSAKT
uniref:Uncharacterized protein n=1 Tax=Anopheles albimanus TaxID=7167 RepID=A0A182FYF5_ANOAL